MKQLFVGMLIWSWSATLVWAAPTPAQAPEAPAEAPVPVEPALPPIKPRLELLVPSVQKLLAEADRSHSGPFLRHVRDTALEFVEVSARGMDRDAVQTVAEQLRGWPDASVTLVTFAPDREGRSRWAVRLDWPLPQLHERAKALIDCEAVRDIVEGVGVAPQESGGLAVVLKDADLAYLLPDGEARSLIASHRDLPVPANLFATAEAGDDVTTVNLVSARFHFTPTEPDSGATLFSSFSVLTALDYSAHVKDDGDWSEVVQVRWPPISGMTLKAFIGSVKQTFVVPDDAFGAVAFNSMAAPGVVDALAGFGPEVMFEDGQMAMIGEPAIGPVTAHGDSETCIAFLPGTGFLPAPDVVFQIRVRKPEDFVKQVRKAAERANELHRERERREPWHIETVRGRTVFWRQGGQQAGAVMMPFIMTPVIFTTRELDARGSERDFAVVALTTTSPERMVRRWLDAPRRPATDAEPGRSPSHLPTQRKTDGQAWINWKQLYDWVHPYIDVGLSVVSTSALLPRTEAVASDLTHALVTADISYTGLSLTHTGPLPFGAAVVPSMIGGSLAADPGGGSDLARERLACERLRVLYHHSELFRKDMGRWPAEVRELDGYVDFSGNPGLLKLRLSSRKQWSEWLTSLFETDEDEDENEEGDDLELDADLYVIDWRRDAWSLGFAPGTFEHLERLYVDQNGDIHRVEKKRPPQPDRAAPAEGTTSDAPLSDTDAEETKEDES